MQASPAELVDRVGQCLREAFQVLSKEQPSLLGTTLSVASNGTAWLRPANCMRVLKVRADAGTVANPAIVAGTEIVVVPFDDLLVSAGVPCLTELGQGFIPSGQAIDPSAGTLTIVYARAPVMPAAMGDQVDALFPTQFDDFLQYDMASYLAIKDKRGEDEQTFVAMKGAILGQIIDWAQQQTYSLVQRFPLVTPPLTNTGGGRQQPVKGG